MHSLSLSVLNSHQAALNAKHYCIIFESCPALTVPGGSCFWYCDMGPGKDPPQDAPVQLNLTRILSVGRIVPNRVCCNCVMAAYARAKPSQYHKVPDLPASCSWVPWQDTHVQCADVAFNYDSSNSKIRYWRIFYKIHLSCCYSEMSAWHRLLQEFVETLPTASAQ